MTDIRVPRSSNVQMAAAGDLRIPAFKAVVTDLSIGARSLELSKSKSKIFFDCSSCLHVERQRYYNLSDAQFSYWC